MLQAATGVTTSTLPTPARITGCGSTRRASKITPSTGSPQLAEDGSALGEHRKFSANEMQSLLKEVDRAMAGSGCAPVHLVAIGGASMLTRVPGRQTGDIDIVSEGLNSGLRRASRTVASRHNLAPDWINDGVKGFAVSIEVEPERIFTGECLVLDSAGPRYLLATKLLSGRESDESDCVHLIRETGIYDESELLDLIQSAAGHRPLRPRDEYWAKEILVLASKGRRMRNVRNWLSARLKPRSSNRADAVGRPEDSQVPQGICGARTVSGKACKNPHPGTGRTCSAGHRR